MGEINGKSCNMSTSWAFQSEAFCTVMVMINLGRCDKDGKEERGKCQKHKGPKELTVFNKG